MKLVPTFDTAHLDHVFDLIGKLNAVARAVIALFCAVEDTDTLTPHAIAELNEEAVNLEPAIIECLDELSIPSSHYEIFVEMVYLDSPWNTSRFKEAVKNCLEDTQNKTA